MSELSERILALREQGMSYRAIQKELGCSKGTIAYHLGEGQVEKNQERQRRIRNTVRDYIFAVKQASICADCGEDYPYWIMEFDHLSDKSFNVSQWKRYSANIEVVKAEIAKCDIVCANCHANRTYLRARNKPGATYNTNLDVSESYS